MCCCCGFGFVLFFLVFLFLVMFVIIYVIFFFWNDMFWFLIISDIVDRRLESNVFGFLFNFCLVMGLVIVFV